MFHRWPFKEAFLLIQAPGVTVDNCAACGNQIVKSDIKTGRKTLKSIRNEVKDLFITETEKKLKKKPEKERKFDAQKIT